jgi:hypothetical protein
MKHYDFADKFRALYDKAVGLHAAGLTDKTVYFTAAEQEFLAANGISVQTMFDYAEDHNNYGEPGYECALEIETVRRDYFLNVQHGKPSAIVLDVAKMPAKTDAVKGIEWLPRLLLKAKAKLRGELPASLMFSCGGDRNFFKTYDILPAEFLSLIWRNGDNDAATVDWVAARSLASRSVAAK